MSDDPADGVRIRSVFIDLVRVSLADQDCKIAFDTWSGDEVITALCKAFA